MLKLTRIDEAVESFLSAMQAARKSKYTISNYRNVYNKFARFVGPETPARKIEPDDIRSFLIAQSSVSDRTVHDYHVALSALWTYLLKESIASVHIVRLVEHPDPEEREIIPFTREQVLALIQSTDRSVKYRRPRDHRMVDHAAQNGSRDRAILYLLLDTGIRLAELCGIKVQDLAVNGVKVFGKGKKERWVPFSETTHEFLWIYLDTRKDLQLSTRVFEIQQRGVQEMLERLGKRTGIPNVHPHRFRHTFAISFLRNGGDPYTLQRILGHTSMEMVKRYLAITRDDLILAHERASPVIGMGL